MVGDEHVWKHPLMFVKQKHLILFEF